VLGGNVTMNGVNPFGREFGCQSGGVANLWSGEENALGGGRKYGSGSGGVR